MTDSPLVPVPVFVGVDVAKDKLDLARSDRSDVRTFPNDAGGVAALVAALAAAAGVGVPVQLVLFAVVSLATLLSTRGIVTRTMQRTPLVRSNVSSLVGRRGVVTVPITSETGRGQIRVGSEYWTARPYMEDSKDIDVGCPVEVLAIEGNAALVLPLDRERIAAELGKLLAAPRPSVA